MAKFFAEIIRYKSIGNYSCNLTIDGKLVEVLSDYYPDYKTMKEQIHFFTGIQLPLKKSLVFTTEGNKEYAYVDATQPCSHGSIVTLEEIKAGHKPDWSVEEDKPRTNWCKATSNPYEAISNLIGCLNSGKNAWIEYQTNGEQDFPLTIKNPALDNPFNWTSTTSACSYKDVDSNFNETQKDLVKNWIHVFSCTKEAVEAYKERGEITKGLIRVASDKTTETHECNVRRTDATKYRKEFTGDNFNYENSPFYNLWVPAKGIPYFIPDPSIKNVFVVCYNNKPVNKKLSLQKATELLTLLIDYEEENNND